MPQLFTNNARALLASGITNSATSLTVEASKADLFPTANTGTGSVPAATNWFKLTLQDSSGNVEIVYVRTRTAGSGVMSNVIRGQEGTTARAFSAGTVVGLRITAADVEGSIAAAANSVQLSGNQTIAGTKTFSNQIIASGGVSGNLAGNVTGNAATVTNGVYTTGDQTIGGVKTFTSVPDVPNDAFSFAKIQNIATARLLGRATAGTGDVEELTAIPAGVDVPAARLSGTIATARLGSGTANNTTFLRGDNTWQTISLTPSTADVLNATAGASVGAVGSYAFLARPESSQFETTITTPGTTIAGSQLRYAGAPDSSATAPAGTWRCMGFAVGFGGQGGENPLPARVAPTLWLRIS